MPVGNHLQDLNIIIGETHEPLRTAFTAMLRQQGVGNVRAARDLPRLKQELDDHAADLVLVSSELDQHVFKDIRKLRRHMFGINPFAVITVMADPSNTDHIKQTASAGADDVLPKPVSPGKVIERAKYIAQNRLPFVAQADYVGPDRRPPERQNGHKPFQVLNSLRYKLDGKSLSTDQLLAKIERDMRRVRTSQLDSFSIRLGQTCQKILQAYEKQQVDERVHLNLKVLNSSLRQAAVTARDLGEEKLSTVCASFEKQVGSLAENYTVPSASQLDLISKLHLAFNQVRT